MRKLRKLIFVMLLASMTLVSMRADTVQLAKAIARAEGFYVANSKAARLHNPGNLRQHGRYRRFRSNAAGWTALYQQLYKIHTGESEVYRVDMTLAQFGKRYSDGSRVWARNVARILGVSPSSFLADLLDVPLQPALDLNEGVSMKISTKLNFGPVITTMADMKDGDVGVFTGGAFKSEVVLRNHLGWFTIEQGRVWLAKDNRGSVNHQVRILQSGESITISRT